MPPCINPVLGALAPKHYHNAVYKSAHGEYLGRPALSYGIRGEEVRIKTREQIVLFSGRAAQTVRTLKAFHNVAQGCEQGERTLGWRHNNASEP